jgi:hypothetical protein
MEENIKLDIIGMVNCSMNKCKKETEDYEKFKIYSYKKVRILFNKFTTNKISKEKYQKESKKIIYENNKRKKAIEYIKCQINNCNNFIKNNVIYTINNALPDIKNKKKKEIFNYYLKLFRENDVTIENYKNFYNDIGHIYS